MRVGLAIEVRARLVSKKFEDLTKELPDVGKGRMRGRLVSAQKRITKYPPRYQGKLPGGFKSEKQRRYFFWALREGIIQVPYQRTGTYGRAWNIERIPDGWMLTGFAQQEGPETSFDARVSRHRDINTGRFVARIETLKPREPYTGWVGGPNSIDQARIHRGRWAPANVAVVESLKGLPKEIREQISITARRGGFDVTT